jgi:hypothetical protein
MLVPGDQWPSFLYANNTCLDEDPWKGLLRSQILVSVCPIYCMVYIKFQSQRWIQAYKHVFTSPSSVEKEPKATRSGNARIHGMKSVTIASIAYIATQVLRFPVHMIIDITLKCQFLDSICSELVCCVLSVRSNNRFRKVLWEYHWISGRPWWERGSW